MPEVWPLEVAASPSTGCLLPEMGFVPLWVKTLFFQSRAVASWKELYSQLLLAAPQGASRRMEIRTEQCGGKNLHRVPDR